MRRKVKTFTFQIPKSSQKESAYQEYSMQPIQLSLGNFIYETDEYVTLQIIPHSSNRNYNSSSIAKVIANLYQPLSKSFYQERDKKVFRTSKKCSFVIYLTKEFAGFYLICPKTITSLMKERLKDIWPSSTVKEANINPIYKNSTCYTYQLSYKYKDALSLAVDKKSNILLNSLANILEMIENQDQVVIFYNIMPYPVNANWSRDCKRIHREFLDNASIAKHEGFTDSLDNLLDTILSVPDIFLDVIFGNEETSTPKSKSPTDKRSDLGNELRSVFGERNKELSKSTLAKVNNPIVEVQAVVISASPEPSRAISNALYACQSYRVIDQDNEITYRKVRNKSLKSYRIEGIESMLMSVDECQNFIQLPGKEVLDKFNVIEQNNVTETVIPPQLLNGYIWLGNNTHSGVTRPTFLCLNKDIASLPLLLVGPMGVGKTFKATCIAKDSIKHKDGVIIIDYIKKCEFADSVSKCIPESEKIVLDLSEENDLQSLAFNEYKLDKSTPFKWAESANLHQQEMVALIDSISIGDPLSDQMRKFFTSAADIVLIHDGKSFKDVITCLESYEERHKYFDAIPGCLMTYLSAQVETLKQLDDDEGGTKYNKVEHIMSRVNLLREDIRLRLMFNKSTSQNIDFAKAMREGKSIIIKMPADKFRSKHSRNVLTTFFISKIWLACNINGVLLKPGEDMRTYHLFLDEIFQAPTSYRSLSEICRQSRKFRLQLIFTVHLLKDLDVLNEGLKSAGASYILLQKCDKSNYVFLKEEIEDKGFSLADILHLKERHSINVINYEDSYCVYEADQTVKTGK